MDRQMKRFFYLAAAAIMVLGCKSAETDPYKLDTNLSKQLEQSQYVHKPMQEIYENSGMYRWEAKEVLETRELPLAEDFASVTNRGGGVISVDKEVTHSGKGSIRLDTPSSGPVKNPTNRNYGTPEIVKTLPGEDPVRIGQQFLQQQKFHSAQLNILFRRFEGKGLRIKAAVSDIVNGQF